MLLPDHDYIGESFFKTAPEAVFDWLSYYSRIAEKNLTLGDKFFYIYIQL